MSENETITTQRKINLSELEVIAFREVMPAVGDKGKYEGSMYPALAKVACEYCNSCHCASY